MDFALPSNFVAWIESEATKMPALAEDLTELALSSRTAPVNRDERIVSDIDSRDIIGEPSVSHKDMAGQLIARFYEKDGRFLGLADEKLLTVLKFSDKISFRKELRNILSRETVREIVLDWVGDTIRNRPTETIAEI